MKKRTAILLVLCMVFSMLPITASAAEVIAGGTCGGITATYGALSYVQGKLTSNKTTAMELHMVKALYAYWAAAEAALG